LPQDLPTERHAIAWLGNGVVGMEIDAQLFFLPFETSRHTLEVAHHVLTLLTPAITQYRRDRIIAVPDWVDDFHFNSEQPLYLEINGLLGKVNRLESELASWKDYKAILSSSGIYLRNKLIALLESVFDLKVHPSTAKSGFWWSRMTTRRSLLFSPKERPVPLKGLPSTAWRVRDNNTACAILFRLCC